ncbi:hypothetical protein BGX29_009547 [Mortierella sp. GBA35]|nr:hypothetical protein BGX29_009547 [Mortierella sp. GBA35]
MEDLMDIYYRRRCSRSWRSQSKFADSGDGSWRDGSAATATETEPEDVHEQEGEGYYDQEEGQGEEVSVPHQQHERSLSRVLNHVRHVEWWNNVAIVEADLGGDGILRPEFLARDPGAQLLNIQAAHLSEALSQLSKLKSLNFHMTNLSETRFLCQEAESLPSLIDLDIRNVAIPVVEVLEVCTGLANLIISLASTPDLIVEENEKPLDGEQ